MAVRYVRSTDGSDADGGTTWALAKATLAGVAAIDTAGDTLWVSQAHSESTAGAVSVPLAGTAASPTRLLCGNDGAEPPTALATTAVVATTSGDITISGASAYVYGLKLTPGVGASTTCNFSASSAGNNIRYENCAVELQSTGTSSNIGSTGYAEMINCTIKFGAAQSMSVTGKLVFRGGGIAAGSSASQALMAILGTGSQLVFDGFDFSNAPSSISFTSSANNNHRLTLRNCKMPGSWSGTLHSAIPPSGAILEMFNCDSADTHYTYRKQALAGTVRDETTVVRTGGASDGTTTFSYKMASNTNARYPATALDSPEIVLWNTTTGSAITATVEILHDSATKLKDNEVWLEVQYLGTSGVPLAVFANDCAASVVATPADQDVSTTTWTTTGLAAPNKQSIAVTFSPQEEGFLHCVVRLAKTSYTIYIDPLVTVS